MTGQKGCEVRMMRKSSTKIKESTEDLVFHIVVYAILCLLAFICIYPLYFVLIASFSNPDEVFSGRVIFWIKDFDPIGYERIFSDHMVVRGFLNSVFYTVAGTLINLAVTLPAAYSLSRKDLIGRRGIMILFVITMYFSGGMIPTYLIVQKLGLYNTPYVLLVCSALSVFNMIIARTFFETTLPGEMLEAVKIDGCNNVRFFFTMALPLSKSMIAVITLYYGVVHWNSYMNALLYINDANLKPLQLVLREMLISTKALSVLVQGDAAVEQQSKMVNSMQYAVIVVATVPMLIAFPFVQKYFVKGVMIGAVKG